MTPWSHGLARSANGLARSANGLALGLLAALAFGCAGTETGNPSFEGELAYDAFSSNVTAVALRAGDGEDVAPGVTAVDSVWLVLGDVSFVGAGRCDAADPSAPAHATGIGEGDHATQGRVVTAVALDEGQYCGLRVPLEPAPVTPISGPAELGGHSILISGTIHDGRAFRIASRMQATIDLESATPFEMSSRAGAVLIGFDVSEWIGRLDWSLAAGDPIVIDAANNLELLSRFEAEIARGTGLYRAGASEPIDSTHPLAQGQ